MSHNLGRVVADGRSFTQAAGLDLVVGAGPLGGPRFVLLHFDNVALIGAARITVELGYGNDVFSAGAGASFWSRPVDGSISPIRIRITGGKGSARLKEFGVGEPSVSPGNAPGTAFGSQTNPDPFLQTSPYQEPEFETRLKCNGSFDWRNAACSLSPAIADAVKDRVAAATGIIVEVHAGHVSSCTGTLIGADLFLTARHCLNDASGEDLRSASVSFDYATACDGTRPAGHAARFFKVIQEVVSGGPPTGMQPAVATDWVVVRLDAAPGALPAPLAMRDAALMVGETIFTMHHPNGAAKKCQAGVHDGGSISGFDYAGGSSGSALFDVNGDLVAGALSVGFDPCTVAYAPVAPVKTALANPPVPAVPLDVMVVFDRSGSMTQSAPPIGRPKLAEAQDAAALFVQLVREGQGDRLGLVTFSSTASLDAAPAAVATAKPDLVGPAPFTTGKIGAIAPGGATSIGAGIGIALLGYGSGSGNDRAMLLLTDGLQNTPPMIEEIEGFLGSTRLNVIGFGSDADIDGPLLARVARDHGGHFTRALDGLALRKFFGLSFGNIFENGALSDPEFVLRAKQRASEPHRFDVCGEERITIILGWDDPKTPLKAEIRTPDGKLVSERRVRPVRGRSWVFWRVPLPHDGERDGTWQFTVERVLANEFEPHKDVRYFFLVVCAGGPKLAPLVRRRRIYTGEAIDPMVGLHYANRTTPEGADVELWIDAPGIALGQLATEARLHAPVATGDAVDGFHATLQAVARRAGGLLPVAPSTIKVKLFDDGAHDDGALEPDGIFNNRLKDLTRVEGTYHFRAVATYGEDCRATREAHWSIHVEPAIDPGRSDVTVLDIAEQPGGRHGTLVIFPRDPYGNPIGPGRTGLFTVSPLPGVVIDGKVKDRGDGSYAVGVVWDPGVTPQPGVLVQQPERDPVVLTPPGGTVPSTGGPDCTAAAAKLLDCLGLHDPQVKQVRVKSVCLEVDLKGPTCKKESDASAV